MSADAKAPPHGGAAGAAGPLIAHRGASALAPENTLAALRLARTMGCGWVEIDAQVCADGVVVLMHDHSVDRTTDGTGAVAMLRGEDVAALRTRDPRSGSFSDARPPQLEQVLALCAEVQLGLVLEIKATWGIDEDNALRIASLVPHERSFPLLVTSFSRAVLSTMRTTRPDIDLGLACLQPPAQLQARVDELGLRAIHANAEYVTAADVARVRGAGLDLAVATVNDASTAHRFLEAGVQGIITDHPDLLDGG